MNKRRFLVGFIIVFLIVSIACQAFASQLDQKKKELNDIKDGIQGKKEAISQVESEQEKIKEQISQIDDNLRQNQQKLAETQKSLKNTQKEIEKIKKELEQAIEKINEQDDLMSSRLRALYMNGPSSYLEIIFESENLNDFIERIETLEKIVEYDIDVLEQMQQYKEVVDNKKVELEKKEDSILKDKQKIEIQREKIKKDKQEKDQLMRELDSQKKEHEKALDELENNSKQLEGTIKKLQQQLLEQQRRLEQQRQKEKQGQQNRQTGQTNRGKYTGGKFGWPVSGYYNITSPYRMRRHPITGVYKMHTGIDIGCPYGASIVAAEAGTVIIAEWFGAYGNTVVIDHGGGVSTLYAHNSSFSVSAGQTVGKGQKIASAGSTGYSTGPHCHFEVRVNGEHTNPLSYLR